MTDLQQPETRNFRNKFVYQMVDRTAMKIAVLIKIAKLPYILNDFHAYDEMAHPFILHTPYGELTKEYEVINYIINESKELSKKNKEKQSEIESDVEISQQKKEPQQNEVIDLTGEDAYITTKMQQKLYDLRSQLFPLFHEFYKYLTGFEKTKKNKYDSLMNKIKKEIASLDSFISQHPQLFEGEANFLTIIIACEMFMACKFVFEEKFRKSKYSLFNKFQKLSHKPQFKQIYGKSEFCSKEYVPTQFEEEEMKPKKKEEIIPVEISKIPDLVFSPMTTDSNRNELLYNYFKTIFNQQESKKNYFPYFWLVFQDLRCTLFEILSLEERNLEVGSHKLRIIEGILRKDLVTNTDYGIVGLYKQQKQNTFMIRGIICLGSKSFEDFQSSCFKNMEEPEFKIHKIDVTNEKQKREAENLWQHVVEDEEKEDISLCQIVYI